MPELNEASFVQMEALNNYAMWLIYIFLYHGRKKYIFVY